MRMIKMKVGSEDPTSNATRLANESAVILKNYCNRKVIENKLATKSFTFDFDFQDNRRNISKSVDRFTLLIKRAIEKRMPFLEYTLEPSIITGTGLGFVLMTTHETVRLNPDVDHDYSPNLRSIERYIRFMNYMSRKHGVPIMLNHGIEVSPNEIDLTRYYAEFAENKKKNKKNKNEVELPIYNVTLRIEATIGAWGPAHENSISLELLDQPQLPDHVLADPNRWSFLSLPLFSEHVGIPRRMMVPTSSSILYPATQKMAVAERIFHFIPYFIQSISTLLRGNYYDFQAFSIKTDPS